MSRTLSAALHQGDKKRDKSLHESGVSLPSLRSKLSPFLDSTSQTMSITALPAVLQHLCLITLTHHQCEELLTRGCYSCKLFAIGSHGCLQCS